LDPLCAEAHVSLARLQREQGQGWEAVASCRQALQIVRSAMGDVRSPDGSPLDSHVAPRISRFANAGTVALLLHQLQQLCLWDENAEELAQTVVGGVEFGAKATASGDHALNAVPPWLFLTLP